MRAVCVPCAQLILKDKPKYMTMRFFCGGDLIDDFGAALLVKLRKDEPRLAQIIANGNKITMAGAQMVADAVTADKDLANIDISEGLWDEDSRAWPPLPSLPPMLMALKEVFDNQIDK